MSEIAIDGVVKSPNVIVVLVDQLRRDALGHAGDVNVRTPNIDRLAHEGVRFSAACSTFPACVPFRFSLMTGEYAHTRNVPALGYRLSPSERTLGDALSALGHATAYIGKWHLYSAYGVSGGLNLSQACRTPIPRSHRHGWDYWRGFELRNDFHDTWYFRDDEQEPHKLDGYQTDGLFDLAFTYLREDRPKDRPFFLLLSVEAPHPPFIAPPAAIDKVASRGPLTHRVNVDVAKIAFFPPEWYEDASPGGRLDPADPAAVQRVFEANMQAWYAMIEVIDENIGRLRDELDAQNLAEDTIVVFLSDHGELGGSHGALGKGEPWEESIGVPLIVHSANTALIPCSRVCDTPVHTEDLFCTFTGLAAGSTASRAAGTAAARLSLEKSKPTDARAPRIDFSAYLRGETRQPTRVGVPLQFVTETRRDRAYYDSTWRGLRTQRYKYTLLGSRSGAVPWQLFDLKSDPMELNNLLDVYPENECGAGHRKENHRELARDLHSQLLDLLDASEDDYAVAAAFGFPARRVVYA